MKPLHLLCIDPGPKESGAVVFDVINNKVLSIYPAIKNESLITAITFKELKCFHLAIEMVASYGMPVGKDVFETVLWTGRFIQAFGILKSTKIYRKDVKMLLCGSMRAKDANIRRALFDLFPATGGGKTPQVGTKKQPGPLYGLTKHAVPALAVGITWKELMNYPSVTICLGEYNES